MTQSSLFRLPAIQERYTGEVWPGARYYQEECCDGIWAGFEEFRSQLAVLATGLGKTFIFSAIARRWIREGRGNVLVLANRNELVQQGRDHLARVCGVPCDIDQAAELASRRAQLVMASVDTVKQKHRLDRYGKEHFSLIICDEAHHFCHNTYMRPLDFFAEAKVLGVTATPDRADEKALGKTFDNVAFCFDILQGIEAGYLVPIDGRRLVLGEIVLDGIKDVAGDLAKGQLDDVMVGAVEGIVAKTLEFEPRRQTIGFFPGVKSAEYATAKFNDLDPGSTGFISAKTDPNERARTTADYKSGKLRRLMNVGIAIEGFDAPATSLILMGRPTKSRMFHAQSAGRGGRVLPGVVDHIPGREGAAARRAAIAASDKPKLVVFDFVGNSSRHDLRLQSVEDLLGGDFSDEEVALAKKKSKEGGDALGRLADARKELAAVAAAIRSKVSAQVTSFNPFAVLDLDLGGTARDDMRWGRLPPSEPQLEALKKMKVPDAAISKMSQREARKLLAERGRRMAEGLASYAQLAQLKRLGLDDRSVSLKNAGRALTYVSSECDWGKLKPVDLKQLSWLASGGQ